MLQISECPNHTTCTYKTCPHSQCSLRYPSPYPISSTTRRPSRSHRLNTCTSTLGTQPRTTLLPNVADPPRCSDADQQTGKSANPSLAPEDGMTLILPVTYYTCRLMLHTESCPRGRPVHLAPLLNVARRQHRTPAHESGLGCER